MNTFILMWDPELSSIDYENMMILFRQPVGVGCNWIVWEWEKAHAGDRFFMVRVGEEGLHGKGNGVVMSGYLTSEPYRGRDWSGRGLEVYYMDLQPDYLFDTEKTRTLTDDFLRESFPQFDWTGGHSGRLLDADTALLLEECWEKALLYNTDLLLDGCKWRIARDVFRRSPVVELFRAHYKGIVECFDAEFHGKGLDVCRYGRCPYYGSGDEYLQEFPEEDPSNTVDGATIEVEPLLKALCVHDVRSAAKVLRRDYSDKEGMRRLLEFSKKAGCKITENVILVD